MVANSPPLVALAFLTADQLRKPIDLQSAEAIQQNILSQACIGPGGAASPPEPQVLPMPTMLTIKELAAEFKEYGISEYYIRLGAKQKKFPSINTGKKTLICRDVFIRHLHGEKFD